MQSHVGVMATVYEFGGGEDTISSVIRLLNIIFFLFISFFPFLNYYEKRNFNFYPDYMRNNLGKVCKGNKINLVQIKALQRIIWNKVCLCIDHLVHWLTQTICSKALFGLYLVKLLKTIATMYVLCVWNVH